MWTLVKDIGKDFLTVWNQPATITMLKNILSILGNIGVAVGNIASGLDKAWKKNETGKKILENIRDIFAAVVKHVKTMSEYTIDWSADLDFSPLLESFEGLTASLVPVVDSISGVLSNFYTQVLLPLGKWTIEKGLPDLLDVFTKFNEKVDWESLRSNLSEFLGHLEPFAETVGEGLIIFISRVSELVANFLNSETFVNFLHDLED